MTERITIDFIRHTRLSGVDGPLCYGRTDLDVAETFPEEAEAVRRSLEGSRYDAVFTSPLRRARKLSDYCGYGDVAVVDDRLAERDFGEWEMKPWYDLFDEVRRQDGLSPLEVEHPELVVPPGGESTEAMLERVRSLVTEIRSHREWDRVACFCHGGVINMARLMVGDIEEGDLFIDVPHYGSVTSIDFDYMIPRE